MGSRGYSIERWVKESQYVRLGEGGQAGCVVETNQH